MIIEFDGGFWGCNLFSGGVCLLSAVRGIRVAEDNVRGPREFGGEGIGEGASDQGWCC